MSDNLKTLTFVIAAIAVAVFAWFARPVSPTATIEDYRNQPLYPDFNDPLKVADLEIISYDETRGEIIPFRVAQVERKGVVRWSIPSHEDYPADARDQVAEAASGLMGLKVLDLASDNEGDQRDFGVVEPDAKKLKLGATGVGQKVVMKDASGKTLLDLIVGKEVPERPGLRYVRKSGESEIYVVEARTDRLSTKFENWIEPNLLQINTFDLKRLLVHDYSVDVLNGELNQRGRMEIDYNDSGEPHWKLARDEKFVLDPNNPNKDHWAPVPLAEDEELNTAKLDELRTALGDLKIVDVSRKPAGLSADLKAAADFAKNREAVESLGRKGFFVARLGNQVELFSNEGEIRLVMRDGVEYVLRFGLVAGSGHSEQDEKSEAKDGKNDAEKTEEKSAGGMNRYLFVMAEFNPDVIPKPEFEKLPEPSEKQESKDAPADKEKAEADTAQTTKPAELKGEETKADEKKEATASTAEKKPDEKKADEKKTDEKSPDAERERIEKENKRKQEEYDRQIADGKKRVAELNARFADWYYVISDSIYKKIHLSRDEIVKKKEKKEATGEAKSGETDGGAATEDAKHKHTDGEHADHEHAAQPEAEKPAENPPASPSAESEKPAPEQPAEPEPAK